MRVLLIGGGAREHAMAARFARELEPGSIVCAPGNPGIARLARTVNVKVSDIDALLVLADHERPDLTVIGPELPLSLGLVDRLAATGRAVIGPTSEAARLESSKAFAKAFMSRHGVPTARSRTAQSFDDALKVVRSAEFGFPVVVKADGLAAGKGVTLADDLRSAESAVRAVMIERKFGTAGDQLVIEECLQGPEVSFFVLSDGTSAVPLGTAQDHKRLLDDDSGPNTGGMGAFAPSPLVDARTHALIMREIIEPVIFGMKAEGHPFRGFLYAGLMLTEEGPKVIEFNVRLGDPEAQVVLPRVEEPLAPLLAAAAEGALRPRPIDLAPDRLTGVVLASRGYPDQAESGKVISGIDAAEAISGVSVYHAGTACRDGQIVTSGGRVLTVVGRADDYTEAIARAYAGVLQVRFDGMQYRRDIGRKALA